MDLGVGMTSDGDTLRNIEGVIGSSEGDSLIGLSRGVLCPLKTGSFEVGVFG